MYRHIVLVWVAKEEDRIHLIEMIKEMPDKIDFLHELEVGRDIMHQGNSYDMGFSCSFDTIKDLQAYYDHPVHKELRTALRTTRQASAMVDWEIQ